MSGTQGSAPFIHTETTLHVSLGRIQILDEPRGEQPFLLESELLNSADRLPMLRADRDALLRVCGYEYPCRLKSLDPYFEGQ